MTKDFHKQRRDDSRPTRPYSRGSSSNRSGDERSFRPTRPRLRRDVVDNAWENGSPQRHADYHPRHEREDSSGRRYQGRNDRSGGRFEPKNSQNRSQPYNERGQSPDTVSGPQQRQQQRQQPFQPRRSSGFQDRGHDNYRDQGRTYSSPRDGERFRSGPSRGNDRDSRFREDRRFDDRPPRSFSGSGPRNDFRSDSTRQQGQPRDSWRAKSRGNSRDDQRPPRRDNRYERPPDTRNPRWQSRPGDQKGQFSRHDRVERDNRDRDELFEGDYESFNARDTRKPSRNTDRNRVFRSNQPPPRPATKAEAEEHAVRHVTRLPDGRVLKGSRPEQRKQAQFWGEISQETESLLPDVHPERQSPPEDAVTDAQDVAETPLPPQIEPPTQADVDSSAADLKTVRTLKTPTGQNRKASASTRARKSRAKGAAKDAPPTGNTPRPSQRGFKWPAAGE